MILYLHVNCQLHFSKQEDVMLEILGLQEQTCFFFLHPSELYNTLDVKLDNENATVFQLQEKYSWSL